MKRLLDLALALLLAVPALLAVVPAALVVWVEAGASPFFRQRRVGRHLRPFTLVKLRTMHVSAPQVGSHEVGTAHMLRSGSWLRRVKLDELPQIWNVLAGDMSFVGPRPCLFSQAEVVAARSRRGVYALLPGITGPAQVAGVDMSTPQLLAELDATYLKPFSLRRDLTLLSATLGGKGQGDAAAAAAERVRAKPIPS